MIKTNTSQDVRTGERGNVLFLILIAELTPVRGPLVCGNAVDPFGRR